MSEFITKQMQVSEIHNNIGNVIGESDWYHFNQERINFFANLVKDKQWIHTDAVRCKKELDSTTIVQGMFIVSLFPAMLRQAVTFVDCKKAINYGINKFRWISEVKVNSKVKAVFKVLSAETENGVTRSTMEASFIAKGQDKPCAIGEFVTLWYT